MDNVSNKGTGRRVGSAGDESTTQNKVYCAAASHNLWCPLLLFKKIYPDMTSHMAVAAGWCTTLRHLLRLAAKVDVVIENFRPGVMEKWGLGPKDLSPDLVYTRISG